MAQDPANPPPPDPKTSSKRGAPAEQGAAKTELTDEQAAKALEKINEVQEKLEPRG